MKTCPICRGTGLALVPVVRLNEDTGELERTPILRLVAQNGEDKWVPHDPPRMKQTLVVCKCDQGTRHRGATLPGPDGIERPRMELTNYEERLNPHWQIEAREEARNTRERQYASLKKDSPWAGAPFPDTHLTEGEAEVAYTWARSQGVSSQQIFGFARMHPAWVILGALSMGIARDIVEHLEKLKAAKETIQALRRTAS